MNSQNPHGDDFYIPQFSTQSENFQFSSQFPIQSSQYPTQHQNHLPSFSQYTNQTSQLDAQSPPDHEDTSSTHSRSINFSVKEDCMLMMACLHVSTDAVVGTNQSGKALWTRVFNYFHTYKDFASE